MDSNTPNPLPEESLPPESEEADQNKAEEERPEMDPLTAYRMKDLETKVLDYEERLAGIREYLKKMETEIRDVRLRAERDQQKAVDQKIGQFFTELLPVLDNLELSLKACEGQDHSIVNGVKMISSQLAEFFKRAGLERLKVQGKAFDPHLHEALMTREVKNPEDDGQVIEELKAGYRFKESIIRPAQVVVGKLS